MIYKGLFLFILAAFILSCGRTAENQSDVKPITLRAESGKTVFELLLSEHEVDYSESGMGMFIKSIDGIENSSGKFWIYYINDERASVACDKYIISEGDKIEWRYE